jgi:light-regulated signal transduction histidine kinase (bacteriophytochrome)
VPSDQDNKRIQELKLRLLAEQKRHSEELRQFAYTVSHDLREPIRMIVSYAQLLDQRYQGQLEGEALDFMSYILDATERIDRLLGDLTTYSHQFRAANRLMSPVDPEGALQGALLTLEAEIRASGAEITSDPLPSVPLDFAQLNQLFRQMIANAITFRGPEPLQIHISATDNSGAIQFSVRDNGIGIDSRHH